MNEYITKIDYRETVGYPHPSVRNIIAYYVDGKWWKKSDYINHVLNTPCTVYVGISDIQAEVVNDTPKYLRSKRNSSTKDNLLSLEDGFSGFSV
jgi:hypothetical protein